MPRHATSGSIKPGERLALRHGQSNPKTPTYYSWTAMKARCNQPGNKDWPRYGGRGITYDPRWADFVSFYDDMGDRPEGMTLDRIDPDGNYERSNCRWATASEQAVNRDWDPTPAINAHWGTSRKDG